MITVIPVASAPFSYIMNGVTLDTPAQITGPILNGGFIAANVSFVVLWRSPTTVTQNALTSGKIGIMTFAAHDGSKMTTQVQVSSVLSGSLLIATFRVLAATPVYRYVIVTQCY